MIIKDTEDLILRLKTIFKNTNYDYSEVRYVDDTTKVIIQCLKHGVFLDTPLNLIMNQIGCPKCYLNSSSGENKVKEVLDEFQIPYEREKTMPELNLKFNKDLRFDFWIPSLKTAIEYNGLQHYQPIDFFGGLKTFNEQQIRDSIKKDFCDFYGFNLLEIKYSDNVREKMSDLVNDYLDLVQDTSDAYE